MQACHTTCRPLCFSVRAARGLSVRGQGRALGITIILHLPPHTTHTLCSGELAAGAVLRDTVNQKGLPAGTTEAVRVLAGAIRGAEQYPRLAGEARSGGG